MKNAFLLSLLSLLLPCATAATPNPADYTVVVHVVFSRATIGELNIPTQQLQCIIDGRQVEMIARGDGVLALGDYKARLLPHSRPKHPPAYDIYSSYELIFPDAKTREFTVSGLGPQDPAATPPAWQIPK